MSPICIIPARGGSVRIERKNIREFVGIPMLLRAVTTARETGLFGMEIFVSTEDAEIKAMARLAGVGMIARPSELAELNGAPDPGTQEVTRHALGELAVPKDRPVCCLYPCTPLLLPEDIVRGYAMLKTFGGAYVYPTAMGTMHSPDPGQFYWGYAWAFLGRLRLNDQFTSRLPIDPRRCIDINTPEDWTLAEDRYREFQAGAAK